MLSQFKEKDMTEIELKEIIDPEMVNDFYFRGQFFYNENGSLTNEWII